MGIIRTSPGTRHDATLLIQKEEANKTVATEFILLAFSQFNQFQILIFVVILLMYATCVTGNVTIIGLTKTEPSLHNLMYFLISVFAFLEILFVSVTIPKFLENLIGFSKKISFTGCFTQLYAINALGTTECYLLAAMAFDRELAINNPLRYVSITSRAFCISLASIPWLGGFVITLPPTILTASLKFCGLNIINHFLCDFSSLQNVACSDPSLSNMATSVGSIFASVIPFFVIMGFYAHIIIVISRIKTSDGKRKAFSTCSSHIIVASLFYGSAIIVYIRPKGSQYDKYFALMYMVVTPLLNPFIYCLRNKDVKGALRKTLVWT